MTKVWQKVAVSVLTGAGAALGASIARDLYKALKEHVSDEYSARQSDPVAEEDVQTAVEVSESD